METPPQSRVKQFFFKKALDRVLLNFLIIFTALITLALLLQMVFVNLVWPTKALQNANQIYDLRAEGLAPKTNTENSTVTLFYPEYIPYQDGGILKIVYLPNDQPVLPFCIELSTSSERIRFLTPDMPTPSDHVIIPFLKNQRINKYITIMNGMNGDELFPSKATITVALLESTKASPQGEKNIELRVETPFTSVLRTSRPAGLNQDSPLLLVFTGMISLGTYLYTDYREHQQKIEEEHRLKSKFKEIREDLKNCHYDTAKQKYEKEFLSPHNKEIIDEMDSIIARKLFNGNNRVDVYIENFSPVPSRKFPKDWADEIAGIIIEEARKAESNNNASSNDVSSDKVATSGQTSTEKILEILRNFPYDYCSKEHSDELRRLRLYLRPTGDVPQNWQWPLLNRVPHPPKIQLLTKNDRVENPFPAIRAESEMDFLFTESDPLFWSKLPIYNNLRDCKLPLSYVTGKPGSGKTALAFALGPFGESDTIGAYQKGYPTKTSIYVALTKQLLTFIKYHPTYLTKLDAYQRVLLVNILLTHFHQNHLLAEVKQIENEDNWKWLNEGSEEYKETWRTQARTQTLLLRHTAEELSESTISDREWPLAFGHIAQTMGFKKVCISIDIGTDNRPEWIQNIQDDIYSTWINANFQTTIFITEDTFDQWDFRFNGLEQDANVYFLNWIEGGHNYLQDMILYRWETWNKFPDIMGYLGKESFKELIKKSKGNPRRFMNQWNSILVTP
jgi:hypothetical protein